MGIGPVEYIVVGFPENKFDGTIIPELANLVQQGLVRVIDLAFVMKDPDGNVLSFEFDDMPGDVAGLADLEGEAGGLLSDQDIEEAAAVLAPNSSAAVLVWEDVWATPFVEAVRRCGGQLLSGARVPHEAVEAALAVEN